MSDPLMDGLRVRFRETARLRLAEMTLLLDAIEGGIAKRDTIDRLSRHFHAMSGLGGTYGYPRVSELGEAGETLMIPVQRQGSDPAPDVVARWRDLVRAIEGELAGDGGATDLR